MSTTVEIDPESRVSFHSSRMSFKPLPIMHLCHLPRLVQVLPSSGAKAVLLPPFAATGGERHGGLVQGLLPPPSETHAEPATELRGGASARDLGGNRSGHAQGSACADFGSRLSRHDCILGP